MPNQKFLEHLDRLISSNEDSPVLMPFDTGTFSIEEVVASGTDKLLEESANLLGEIMHHYEGLIQSAAQREELQAIGDELTAAQVAGVAFVARGQIIEASENLAKAKSSGSIWQAVGQADAGHRHALKGLITIESAIRELEDLPALDRRWINLDDSIEIRRLYSQFRRAVLRGGEPTTQEDTISRLKKAVHRIAILRDLKLYPILRIDDRLELRSLQKRIVAWLESDRDLEAGRRLWQDMASFARLLRQINMREELREHDRKLLNEVDNVLFGGGRTVHEIPTAIRERLQTLEGKDDELDEFLRKPESLTVEALRAPLARLKLEAQRLS